MLKHLHRNPDGSLKIYDLDDLPPRLRDDYSNFASHKFFLGTIEDDEQKQRWVLPMSKRHFENLSPDALELIVSQKFEAY